ncbi:benzoate membrane transport protein [Noviherbaspirillum humi]|uniref:Benzoate membrane transport protein n=1 Tax=Noviherbaspirillum humi TaxID=1688639 RepID=A0A239F081_9BURK|nr:benzoate/H(+) symporter BenE family transporter [Noviherbaspirillum humi]SNS49938.1 benzoate membrane transport protein [Noviherbaspirillum humi]
MAIPLERPATQSPFLRQVLADFSLASIANGLIGFIFAATGPVAIILSVGTTGGLSRAELASWVFGVFFINGLITLAMSWRYKTPLGFAWTIPGTVLVGPALQHLSFAQVIGAFYATGALVFLLGASGWVKRVMASLPMPIVMGMVAGVFLRFGLDLVRALHDDIAIAGTMVLAFLVLSAKPGWGKRLPPIIGALIIGALAIALLGRLDAGAIGSFGFAMPLVQAPMWSAGALVELVIPLAITVLVVQNGQGVAVLRNAGHEPPVNAIAVACGLGSLLAAVVGAVSTCLTGPTNALMTSSGERSRQYTAAFTYGTLALLFGLMAPTFTGLMLAAPKAYIMVLGGLAMLRVLQGAFVASFGGGRFTLGALVSLLVTVADLGLLNIGAAFWGLVAGFAVSWLMERQDFIALEHAGGK